MLRQSTFDFQKNRLRSAVIDETKWPADPQAFPDDWNDRNRILEAYGYNVFGERVAVMHCSFLTPDGGGPWHTGEYPDAAGSCRNRYIRLYDYVNGQLLAEREHDDILDPPVTGRFISIYTWGVMGLVPRRGVSVRDGSYDAQSHTFTPSDPPNPMCDYTYMMDHMGNVAALVDTSTGNAQRQLFDAFGNTLDSLITFRCESDYDTGELLAPRYCDPPGDIVDCHDEGIANCIPECPAEFPHAAEPIERMQAGGFHWRGGEGSITDRVAEEQRDHGNPDELRHSAYTKPSTGLIYMQARYYEPQTGRFTQADAVAYGAETVAAGQNNRWTYCANDPVNCSDPTGDWFVLALIAGYLVSGALGILGQLIGGPVGTALTIAAIAVGTITSIAAVVGEAAVVAFLLALWAGAQAMFAYLISIALSVLLFVQTQICRDPRLQQTIQKAIDALKKLVDSRKESTDLKQPLAPNVQVDACFAFLKPGNIERPVLLPSVRLLA